MTKTPIQPPTRQDLLIFQGLQRAIVEKKSVYQNRFQSVEQNRFSVFQSVGKRFAFAGDFNAVAGVDDCQQSDDGNDCFNGFGFGIRFFNAVFFGTVYAKPRGQACRSPNRKVFNRMAIRRIFDLPFRRCAGFLLCAARGLADVCGILFSRFDSRRQYGRIR